MAKKNPTMSDNLKEQKTKKRIANTASAQKAFDAPKRSFMKSEKDFLALKPKSLKSTF